MVTILAPGLLPEEKVETMRPKEKQRYIENIILKVLELNPMGVTISAIEEKTHFARNTVTKHLNKLAATRQASKLIHGSVSVYYRNGSVTSAFDFRDKNNPGHFYTVEKLRNLEGEFLYIQEKEVDELQSIRVRGGIMISSTMAPELISKLRDFMLEIRN